MSAEPSNESPNAQPSASVRGRRTRDFSLRSIFLWIHLSVGLAAAVVILVMSATGVLLTYEHQIEEWSATRHWQAPVPAPQRLPLDTVLARVEHATGKRVASISVFADASRPVTMGLEGRKTVYADPFTGAVIGNPEKASAFFSAVTRWHRWLGQTRDSGWFASAKMATGVSNIIFLFLLLSGLYLWWPRQLTARAFKAVGLLNVRASGKARDWNWHHVFGIWAAPVLVFVVASGVFMSYRWPSNLIASAFGEPPREEGPQAAPAGREGGSREGGREGGLRPERRRRERDTTAAAPLASVQGRSGGSGGERIGLRADGARGAQGGRPRGEGEGGGPPGTGRPPVKLAVSVDTVFAHALVAGQSWYGMQLRVPTSETAPITVSIATSSGTRPDKRTSVTMDSRTAEVTKRAGYADMPASRRVTSWVRGVHTGEAFGLIGQTLAGLVSLAGVILVYSGFALSVRRFRGWVRRRAKARAAAPGHVTRPATLGAEPVTE